MEENKSHETETAPYCVTEWFRAVTSPRHRGRGILLREECSKFIIYCSCLGCSGSRSCRGCMSNVILSVSEGSPHGAVFD